jgi:hypothetical protein
MGQGGRDGPPRNNKLSKKCELSSGEHSDSLSGLGALVALLAEWVCGVNSQSEQEIKSEVFKTETALKGELLLLFREFLRKGDFISRVRPLKCSMFLN